MPCKKPSPPLVVITDFQWGQEILQVFGSSRSMCVRRCRSGWTDRWPETRGGDCGMYTRENDWYIVYASWKNDHPQVIRKPVTRSWLFTLTYSKEDEPSHFPLPINLLRPFLLLPILIDHQFTDVWRWLLSMRRIVVSTWGLLHRLTWFFLTYDQIDKLCSSVPPFPNRWWINSCSTYMHATPYSLIHALHIHQYKYLMHSHAPLP